MSLPVNIGDAIAIAQQICNIYEIYKSTPLKLREALRTFEDVEKECKELNDVLSSSRRKEKRSYPDTVLLVQDLEKARDFFSRYEPLLDSNGKFYMKVKKTFCAKWSWADVQHHIGKINRHREKMRDFKANVLIQAVQDNIELSLYQITKGVHAMANSGAMVHSDASSLHSDCASIMTRANRSLKYTKQLQIEPFNGNEMHLSPVIEIATPSIRAQEVIAEDNLKDQIARFIKRKELHKEQNFQMASLRDFEYLANLPARWLQSQRDETQPQRCSIDTTHNDIAIAREEVSVLTSASPSVQQRSAMRSVLQLPTYASGIIPEHDAISISESWNIAFNEVQHGIDPVLRPNFLGQPALSLDDNSSCNGASVRSLNIHLDEARLVEGVKIITPFTKRALECQMRLHRSESSLCISSSTLKTFNRSALESLIDSLGPGSPNSAVDSISSPSDTMCLRLNHAVRGGMSSFPKIFHPTAEIPSCDGDYPYVIEFYDHQYLQVEGFPRLKKAVKGIQYQFKRKLDRDFVRQEIFGKQLLASAGTATVQFDTSSKSLPKPCSTQATSLWKDTSVIYENGHGTELIITLQCNTKGRQTGPDCAREFLIVNFDRVNATKVKNNQGKELRIDLQPIELENQELLNQSSPDEVLSSNSTTSNLSLGSEFSARRSQGESRRSSIFSRRPSSTVSVRTTTPLSNRVTCYIKFSEGSPSLMRLKEQFLDALLKHT